MTTKCKKINVPARNKKINVLTNKLTLAELQELYVQRWNYPPIKKYQKPKYVGCVETAQDDTAYVACWERPEVPASIRFGPCWEYLGKKEESKPKLPSKDNKELDVLIPNFDNVKTIYTKLDFKLERCVHEQILKLDKKFEAMRQQLSVEKEQQLLLIEEIRYQSTRYRLLVRGVCVKPYPDFVSIPAEHRALCAYQKCLEKLTISNVNLGASMLIIKDMLIELKRRIDQLDQTVDSPFINGNGTGAPSLAKVVEMLEDLYKYFYGVVCKMKRWAELIDPGDLYSIQDYEALLKDSHDFPTFMRIGTDNCTCKRNESKKPLERYVPCWCQRYELYMEKPKPWPKYRCDVHTMTRLSTSTSQLDEEEDIPNCLDVI